MEIRKIGELYCQFRDSVLEFKASIKTFPAKMQESFPPLAKELHIGALSCTLSAPASDYAPNGEEYHQILFQDKSTLPVLTDMEYYAEQFPTCEGGLYNVMIYPEANHEYTEEEERFYHLLAIDCYVLGGRARLMDYIKYAITTEPMTRTDNQMSLFQKMGEMAARGTLKNFTGVFLNLKNFKYVNKSMSSVVGDLAIKIFANSIKESLEENEIVSRLGGDNFYVLLKDKNLQKFITRFEKFEISLEQGLKPLIFTLSCRMGIHKATSNDTPSEMMNFASIALNSAREMRYTDLVYFSNDLQVKALHRREISTEFHGALQRHEFVVHYQPKVNLQTRQLCGSEALVRWIRHKTIVPPMDFIPILEQEGTVCQLDFYVLHTVCRDIRQWQDNGITPVRISVNISKCHLKNPKLADDILAIIAQHHVDCKYIEVELTEVSDYDDYMTMQNFVSIMRKNGISVSIDDFGTGYSTLNVLKNFDVNVIKLDKSLLDNIGKENSMDEVVVKNVINMATEMHKDVIAEGVENEIQAQFLAKVNCNQVQGYLFDKPMNHDEFQKRLTGEKVY